MAGKAITILGISAGLVAMAPMTSCSSSPNKGSNQETISDSANTSVMFGEVCPDSYRGYYTYGRERLQ